MNFSIGGTLLRICVRPTQKSGCWVLAMSRRKKWGCRAGAVGLEKAADVARESALVNLSRVSSAQALGWATPTEKG